MTLLCDFWEPVPITPIAALAALRKAVVERTRKRMPTWKFRLSPAIVAEIKPKVILPKFGVPGFEGSAVMHDDEGFNWKMTFRLLMGDEWRFKPWNVRCRASSPKEVYVFCIRDRLIAILPTALATLRPEIMLQPACLLCGRQLTDPISQARWIGPECNGSASAINPFILNLSKSEDLRNDSPRNEDATVAGRGTR
jgi:hypothetical protein